MRAGHRVSMLVRDVPAGERLREQLIAQTPDAQIAVLHCDLASLASVRTAAHALSANSAGGDSAQPIDRLIHNAGTVALRAQATVDGHERVFATNHLGPFLLNELLLDGLSPQARVIIIASCAHEQVKHLSPDALDALVNPSARPWRAREAYARSKLANLLWALALARRLTHDPAGRGITVHAVHPGIVHTHLLPLWLRVLKPLVRRDMISAEEGARTPLHLALDPGAGALHGCYMDERQHLATPSALARDEALQDALYHASRRWVGLQA